NSSERRWRFSSPPGTPARSPLRSQAHTAAAIERAPGVSPFHNFCIGHLPFHEIEAVRACKPSAIRFARLARGDHSRLGAVMLATIARDPHAGAAQTGPPCDRAMRGSDDIGASAASPAALLLRRRALVVPRQVPAIPIGTRVGAFVGENQ